MIKKIRFEIAPDSYAEMAHLEFFNNGTELAVNISAKTLTLKDNSVHTFTAKASSEYGSGYYAIAVFSKNGPAHSGDCWCSSGTGGTHWLELEFTPPLPNTFANKITFCCGQNEGSYPGTFTLFFIDENGNREQIGEPLSVNAHNGIFEWVSIIRCIRGKDGNYYFLRPDAANTSSGSTT